jgi:hypothetical protein
MSVKHRGMPSPWEKDFRPRDLSTDPSGIAIGYARVYPLTEDQVEHEHAHSLRSGLWGSLEPQALDRR